MAMKFATQLHVIITCRGVTNFIAVSPRHINFSSDIFTAVAVVLA